MIEILSEATPGFRRHLLNLTLPTSYIYILALYSQSSQLTWDQLFCVTVCWAYKYWFSYLQGRARFELYQRVIALVFAAAQSWGALLFVRPYVADFGGSWLFESMLTLVVGSVIMNHVSSAVSTSMTGIEA